MQPQGKVTYVEFRETMRMLNRVATHQVGKRGNLPEVADTSRIHEFLGMNPQATQVQVSQRIQRTLSKYF